MSNTVQKSTLPKKFHDAVVRWQETFIPDYDFLQTNWDRYFPHQPRFELCAYHDCSVCPHIEVGDLKGQEKFCEAKQMNEAQANHLLKAVRAQASTELGSIQQHRLTLARAQDEQDQFWILRMMAEELRHGYQMFHILLNDDWKSVSDHKGEEMVEEILNMRTGSHVLGAFNVDFDSFLDNVTFCAVIDRVGKYQLQMQKVSAYRPMSESMPPMLREEAFHLAAGVTPIRRMVGEAGEGKGTITMEMVQQAFNKWFPRGLDMFGDERGGGSNVRMGFKDMKNFEAQSAYIDEVQQVIDDLNMRYVRAKLPKLSRTEATDLLRRVVKEGESVQGIVPGELLTLPHRSFFRRRGPDAYRMVDRDGNDVAEVRDFKRQVMDALPAAYTINRDFKEYLELVDKLAAGEVEQKEAVATMPVLSRVGGACPCSNAVRWVRENGAAPKNGNGNGHG